MMIFILAGTTRSPFSSSGMAGKTQAEAGGGGRSAYIGSGLAVRANLKRGSFTGLCEICTLKLKVRELFFIKAGP
jgi:hypothetical protein